MLHINNLPTHPSAIASQQQTNYEPTAGMFRYGSCTFGPSRSVCLFRRMANQLQSNCKPTAWSTHPPSAASQQQTNCDPTANANLQNTNQLQTNCKPTSNLQGPQTDQKPTRTQLETNMKRAAHQLFTHPPICNCRPTANQLRTNC